MAESAKLRLNKVLRELNISLDRAVEHLSSKGFDIEARPTTKITSEVYNVLLDEFQTDRSKKVASKEVGEEKRKEKEAIRQELEKENELKRQKQLEEEQEVIRARATLSGPKTVGKIDLGVTKKEGVAEVQKEEKPLDKASEPVQELEAKPKPEAKEEAVEKTPVKEEKAPEVNAPVVEPKKEEKPVAKTPEKPADPAKDTKSEEVKKPEAPKPVEAPKAPVKTKKMIIDDEVVDSEQIKTKYTKLSGPNFTGEKIDLSQFNKPKKKKETKEDPNKKGAKATNATDDKKKRRRRISKDNKDARPNANNNTAGGNKFNKDNNRNNRRKGGPATRRPVEKVEPTE